MIKKIFYFEFLIPITDYLKTIKLKEFIYEILSPIIVSILLYRFILYNSKIDKIDGFIGSLIGLLAILIGFSITCITVLSTNTSDNVIKLKQTNSERKIGGKKINLYQLILITFTYLLMIEIFTLLFNLTYALLFSTNHCKSFINIYYTINSTLLLHIFLLNIRNITNFYHIFFAKS